MKTASEVQRRIQQSRQRIALEYAALGEELNVVSRLRHSVQRKPWTWISGAALTGVALSFFRPSHRVKISAPKKSETALPSSVIMEGEKSISTLSKVIVVTTAILENETLRTGLFSAARYLFPLLQQAARSYAARKRAAAAIARD